MQSCFALDTDVPTVAFVQFLQSIISWLFCDTSLSNEICNKFWYSFPYILWHTLNYTSS